MGNYWEPIYRDDHRSGGEFYCVGVFGESNIDTIYRIKD
jgi:hypothetical protein